MNKFQEAIQRRPELERIISRKEKDAKIAEMMMDLKGNKAMEMLLEELCGIIKGINAKLLSHDRLETEQREVLMADKERCEWLLNKFPGYEKQLENINSYIEKL